MWLQAIADNSVGLLWLVSVQRWSVQKTASLQAQPSESRLWQTYFSSEWTKAFDRWTTKRSTKAVADFAKWMKKKCAFLPFSHLSSAAPYCPLLPLSFLPPLFPSPFSHSFLPSQPFHSLPFFSPLSPYLTDVRDTTRENFRNYRGTYVHY